MSGLISFVDPAGNRLEAFHDAQSADEPFRAGRSISGFRTGPLGIGHALLMVPSIDAALQFYRDLLGFRISDYIRTPVCAYLCMSIRVITAWRCSKAAEASCII